MNINICLGYIRIVFNKSMFIVYCALCVVPIPKVIPTESYPSCVALYFPLV